MPAHGWLSHADGERKVNRCDRSQPRRYSSMKRAPRVPKFKTSLDQDLGNIRAGGGKTLSWGGATGAECPGRRIAKPDGTMHDTGNPGRARRICVRVWPMICGSPQGNQETGGRIMRIKPRTYLGTTALATTAFALTALLAGAPAPVKAQSTV